MKMSPSERIVLLLLSFGFFISCDNKSIKPDLLKQAQTIVETNPADALILLDSIREPEKMDKNNYMQYVVMRVQAKHKTDHDITDDTLIFEAQNYFNKGNNIHYKVLATYYTGVVYRMQKDYENTLKYLLQAKEYANRSADSVIVGKSFHIIGNLYYDQQLFDTAITHYQKAMNHYNLLDGTDVYKLQALTSIGCSYYDINQFDSAFLYFDNTLQLANKIDNHDYKMFSIHNLGAVYIATKEYAKASLYSHKAISLANTTEDSLKLLLNLLIVHTENNRLDSALYYNNYLKERLSEIKNDHTLSLAYRSFSEYYKKSGNYQEALYYRDFQHDIDKTIAAADNSRELLNVEKQYRLNLKEKELAPLRIRTHLYISVGTFVVLLIILAGWVVLRDMRHRHRREKEIEKNKLLEAENALLGQQLTVLQYMQNIYQNLLDEWMGIEKDVNVLAREYGAKEKPQLYVRIQQMVGSIKVKTNEQLTNWAKSYLHSLPNGDKALELLNERELLLLGLCYCKFSLKDMCHILEVAPVSLNISMRKLDLRNKLEKVAIPILSIDQIFGKVA